MTTQVTYRIGRTCRRSVSYGRRNERVELNRRQLDTTRRLMRDQHRASCCLVRTGCSVDLHNKRHHLNRWTDSALIFRFYLPYRQERKSSGDVGYTRPHAFRHTGTPTQKSVRIYESFSPVKNFESFWCSRKCTELYIRGSNPGLLLQTPIHWAAYNAPQTT